MRVPPVIIALTGVALVASHPHARVRAVLEREARARSGPVAIVGVSVLPMTSERVTPAQTVTTENGRITYVGPASEARVPVARIPQDLDNCL